MRVVILAAGVGHRLARPDPVPKVLLRFGGESLLSRHLRILGHFGLDQIDMCVGHRAGEIDAEVARIGAAERVVRHLNPDSRRGSVVSLWTVREVFASGEAVIFMDGDVLYDHRMIEWLLAAEPPNCFLMDRNIDPGEDPVKLCIRDGALVDFRKRPANDYDSAGEWIGFARFTPEAASGIAAGAQAYVDAGRRDEPYEEVFRDALLSAPPGAFGVEDVSSLPWIEIDFPEDLERAEREIYPRLAPLPE